MKARIIMLLLISLSCTLFAQKNDTESLPINSRFSEISPVGREVQEQSGLKIVCGRIEEDGFASAYESYNFSIENNTVHPISEPQWTYTLPLKGGGESIIATSPNDIFTIPIVESKDLYDIDTDHCISGKILFSCIIDGEESVASYNIMLDLKPHIISYSEIIKTVNETNTAYSIDFTVRYVGSDFLEVGVREEYSPFLEIQTIEEPFVAHVRRSGINTFDCAWVWLHVYNEYGEDEVVITLESDITGVQTIHSDFVNASVIKIYTKEGKYMMQITNWDDLKELNQEIYILQLCNKDGIPFKTIKYLKGQ
ncbi:hypothetical protein [Bacteroides nordii]|uniref:Uncharacterized protein n=1 Tax=Bacteroides nordii CL02T12C05 TaxID=997884 RepID=I9SDS7_9BACE|nr:hypothetical protein [Bacteroides nordii]EIY53733.1 hypothetical protein HMPREF1068_00903 [Bacteroides nordii CL02T12C05]MCE8466784.1 hypothetical protein [Bacteroides nordii]MCG4769983.1 hypothetical protein [Bacteroides nordii]UYU48403.1 hypothetical protein KQP55_17265 [Bacteroides nordii]